MKTLKPWERPKKPKALWTTIPGWEPKEKTTKATKQASRQYAARAKEFIHECVRRGETCPVVNAIDELRQGSKYGHPISSRLNEVHHKRGRRGDLLCDERFWMPVSKQGHRWIHEHPAEARRRGWLCEVGQWNVPAI